MKGLILGIAVIGAFIAYQIFRKLLASITVALTIFGIGLSIYAYKVEKSSMGNLAGAVFAIVGLVGTLTAVISKDKPEETVITKSNQNIDKVTETVGKKSLEKTDNTVEDSVVVGPLYSLNDTAIINKEPVSLLSSEQEKDLIEIAYNHGSISIRNEAAKELIKKSRKQDIIIEIAYNHGSIFIQNKAAELLIEKSDDKNVIRKLANEYARISIRNEAAKRLMNWHSNVNNYFH